MKLLIPQFHPALQAAICLLLLLCHAERGHAQTALEVPQALVIRNSGSVQVVAKDGKVREAFVTPKDNAKPASKKPEIQKPSADTTLNPEGTPKLALAGEKPDKNAYVFAGETLRTGKDGSADLALVGAGSMRVEADSEVKLPEKQGEKPVQESLEVLKGKLFFNIDGGTIKKQQGQQEFRIKTPVAILAVKGTRFFVASGLQGDTIGVHQGEVSAFGITSKQTQLIGSGFATDATLQSLSASRPLLAEEKEWNVLYAAFELNRIPLLINGTVKTNSHNLTFRAFYFYRADAKGGEIWPASGEYFSLTPFGPQGPSTDMQIKRIPHKFVKTTLEAVAGFQFALPREMPSKAGQEPCVLEFWLGCVGLNSIETVPVTLIQAAGMKRLSMVAAFQNRITLGVDPQPFWKWEEGHSGKLPPTELGLLSKFQGKPSSRMQWARVQIPWESGTGGIYIFTRPGNAGFANEVGDMRLSIRDFEVLTSKQN